MLDLQFGGASMGVRRVWAQLRLRAKERENVLMYKYNVNQADKK